MVDFDIIHILREYVGYTCWSDVQLSEKACCFPNYTARTTLPDWYLEGKSTVCDFTKNTWLLYILCSTLRLVALLAIFLQLNKKYRCRILLIFHA
jgi:hypothetical protein